MKPPNGASVFISYASADRPIVSAAARLLRAGGATVFQDVVDIEFGERWKETLFAAIARCDRVMVFWSAAAADSAWVEKEWRAAVEAEKRIVPMVLDDTPLPPPLSEFHGVPDMVDMLRAAMSIAPASVAAAAPARGLGGRTQRVLLAVVGGLTTLAAVLSGWIFLQSWQAPDVDRSRSGPQAPAPTVINGLTDSWGLVLTGLAVGSLLAWVLYLKIRRGRAKFGGEIAALPEADLPAEFIDLGSRFTSATFDDSQEAGDNAATG